MPATITASSPTSGPLALSMTRDKAATFAIAVFEADGITPMDITDVTLRFYAAVGLSVISKSSPDGGITIDSSTGGLATLLILPVDTLLSGLGISQGNCELTMIQGDEPFNLAAGTLTIYPNVGTP